jgi:hypothetical protein
LGADADRVLPVVFPVTARHDRPRTWTRLAGFGFLAILGLGSRLLLAWTAPRSVDLESYSIVAEVMSSGKPLYESTTRYNYSPAWAEVVGLLDRFSRSSRISFPGLVRSLLTVVDLLSALVLWLLARRQGTEPWRVAGLFLVNPVSIWVTSIQGQFDNLSLLFLLLAMLVSPKRDRSVRRSSLPAVGLLTLSVVIKQITALHPILWIGRTRNRILLLVPYLGAATLFLFFLPQLPAIRDNVLLYRTVPRSYGLSELILLDDRWAVPVSVLALAAGLFTAWRLRNEPDLARAALMLFLVLLVFAPGFGTQYAVWPLTLGALRPGAGYFLCSLSTILWTLGSHFGVHGSGRWMGHLVWLSFLFWLARESSASSRRTDNRLAVELA